MADDHINEIEDTEEDEGIWWECFAPDCDAHVEDEEEVVFAGDGCTYCRDCAWSEGYDLMGNPLSLEEVVESPALRSLVETLAERNGLDPDAHEFVRTLARCGEQQLWDRFVGPLLYQLERELQLAS